MAAALQSVQTLLAAGKAQEARLTLRDVEQKLVDRTPYENYLFQRLKAAAAVALSDDAAAAAATQEALVTGKASVEERRTMLAQLTGFALKLKDNAGVLKWSREHVESGGADENVRAALVRAALVQGDCTLAVEHLTVLIDAGERRGEKPAEPQLRALAACHAKLGRDDGYYAALERLLRHHPRKEYWADIIARLQRRPGFSDRMLLDSFRLMARVGAMEDADDFMSAAQLAVLAALPGEARAFLQVGFDSGALGKGPGAAGQRELMSKVSREAEADRSQLDEAQRQAASAADGRRLFQVGQAALSYGQPERALQLMEQALAKGIGRHPMDARLHHAIALAAAGRSAEAKRQFADLPAQDGLAELGRLWQLAVR